MSCNVLIYTVKLILEGLAGILKLHGEYIFESEALPGYYLTVDLTVNADGRPFLAESWGIQSAIRDPRHRFALFAGTRDLQMTTTQF